MATSEWGSDGMKEGLMHVTEDCGQLPLLVPGEDYEQLRRENADLNARIGRLEALVVQTIDKWAESLLRRNSLPSPSRAPNRFAVTHLDQCAQSVQRKLLKRLGDYVAKHLAWRALRGESIDAAIEKARAKRWEIEIVDPSHPWAGKGKKRLPLTYIVLWEPDDKGLTSMRRRVTRILNDPDKRLDVSHPQLKWY